MCLCSCAHLCVSVMLATGMCWCSGPLRSRRAQKKNCWCSGHCVCAGLKKKIIKKEYCRCGLHPLQVTSSRARPPLVKGAGLIGPLFPEFRGWRLWFMASIALWGSQNLAPEVVPGASLHSEALSPECGRECLGTGDCGPTRHVEAGLWGLLLTDCSRVARVMTPGPPPQPHG